MNDARPNSPSPLPPDGPGGRAGQPARPESRPIGEEQLLDWIDGRLPASEMARLEASSGRQGLGDRVRQMQANRRALRSMPLERAPHELMDRVVQALEREQVLGSWQDNRIDPDHPSAPATIVEELAPISIEEYRSTTPPAWIPRLAMAAGVALLLAGGAYWAVLLTAPTGPRPSDTSGSLASADASPQAPALATNETFGTLQTGPAASDMTGTAGVMSDGTALATAAPAPSATSTTSTTVATASEGLDLAAQGRLILRVLASPATRLASVGSSNANAWSLSREVPAHVALAVLASRTITEPDPSLEGPAMPATLAASAEARRLITPLVGPAAAFSTLATMTTQRAELASIASTLILDVAPTEEALEEARAGLSRALGAEVVLERAPLAISVPASTDPARVLWWTKPPATWTPKLRIPVIVESAR